MSGTDAPRVKVATPVDGGATETLWAIDEGKGRYRLDNLPYLAFGLSLGDVVSVKRDHGQLVIDQVLARSGHSTYRLALQDALDPDAFVGLCAPLTALGCGLERFTPRMMGVDVPPAVDIGRAYALISGGMATGSWWFDEVHVGHGNT
jgi:hypothetical protein